MLYNNRLYPVNITTAVIIIVNKTKPVGVIHVNKAKPKHNKHTSQRESEHTGVTRPLLGLAADCAF